MQTLFLSQLAARLQRCDERAIDVVHVGTAEHGSATVDSVVAAPGRENTWFFEIGHWLDGGFAAHEQELALDLTGQVEVTDTWGEVHTLHLSITRPAAAEDFV